MYLKLFVIFVFSSLLASCGSTRWTHPNLTQSKFDMDVNNCRYQSQMATQQQPRQETYEQSLQRGIALAQLDPAARGAAMTYSGARGLGGAIAGAMGVQDPQTQRYMQLMFNQCMFGLGYQLQN